MATQIFQNTFLSRNEILKPIQKMAGEAIRWISGSQFILGGKFYQQSTELTVNLTGLSANTLYMVYAVISGNLITNITYSTNFNTVGPAGATAWKLIGAFYSSGASTFGSLVNIEGVPTSDIIPYTPSISSQSGTITNSIPAGYWKRMGESSLISFAITFSGSSGTWSRPYISFPSGIVIDTVKSATSTQNAVIQTSGTPYFDIYCQYDSPTLMRLFASQAVLGGPFSDITQASPVAINTTTGIVGTFSGPIVGWTNTPLKDL